VLTICAAEPISKVLGVEISTAFSQRKLCATSLSVLNYDSAATSHGDGLSPAASDAALHMSALRIIDMRQNRGLSALTLVPVSVDGFASSSTGSKPSLNKKCLWASMLATEDAEQQQSTTDVVVSGARHEVSISTLIARSMRSAQTQQKHQVIRTEMMYMS